MKSIFLKKLNSYLFLVLVLPLFFSPLISSAQDSDPADCAFYEVGSDVWYAQGCDTQTNCAPGFYVPPGNQIDECVPIPTGGGGGGSTGGGGGIGGGSGFTGSCDLETKPKFSNLVDYVVCIINISVIPFIFALALALFVYGVMQYMLNDSDESKREKGKQLMVWGIVALTVMLGVWGLVAILGGTFGFNISIIPQVSTN